MSFAYAETPLQTLQFYPGQKEIIYGFKDTVSSISFQSGFSSGNVDNNNFKIYDKDNNLLMEGSSGTIKMDKDVFPIRFVCQATTDDFRIDLEITSTPGITLEDVNDNLTYSNSLLESILGSLSSLLSSILDTLRSLLNSLNALSNYLTNPEPFYTAMDGLNDEITSISDKGFMGQIKDLSSNVNLNTSSSVDSALPSDLNFIVTFPGIGTFNVLDLSNLQGLIAFIRLLMSAILWIGLLLYLIRFVMPRFKI